MDAQIAPAMGEVKEIPGAFRSKGLNCRAHLLRSGTVQHFPTHIKSNLKDLTGLALFPFFRITERCLSPASFHAVLKPVFGTRAVFYAVFNRHKKPVLPAFLQMTQTRRIRTELRTAFYLNHVLDYFPERLTGIKWKGRCRFEGLGHLQAARQNGRPVILAFFHFGPYFLLRSWLRVAGFPAGSYLVGKAAGHTRVRRFTNRFYPWPKIVFGQDQVEAADEFLKAGNLLLVALDMPRGQQINIPFGDGWTFQMAASAMHLARTHQADLIPCCIVDEGDWNFQIRLGSSVPRELLVLDSDLVRAGKHLIDEVTSVFHAHPHQCHGNFSSCLKPDPSVMR